MDNRASENIVSTLHEGDLVQNGALGDDQNQTEWDRADTAMDTLDTVPTLPYLAVIGNHDYDIKGADPANKIYGASRYIEFFGPTRYSDRTWYGGASADATNHYMTFQGDGQDFLVLGLEWQPSDLAIGWAKNVINDHPGMPTIIVTHEYLDTLGNFDGNAQAVFDNLISPNPQVFMVLCGHNHGESQHVSTNAAGKPVYEILADYQERANGGDGWMRLLTFKPNDNEIQFRTYSPTLDSYETDANSQFTLSINFDDPRFTPAQPTSHLTPTLMIAHWQIRSTTGQRYRR